jgi:hypothetical protein
MMTNMTQNRTTATGTGVNYDTHIISSFQKIKNDNVKIDLAIKPIKIPDLCFS